jgi:hypothetical protein
MNMVRNEDIGQINRRGNPLWLPKIMGRHVERSNVYYTRPAPTKDFSIPKSAQDL